MEPAAAVVFWVGVGLQLLGFFMVWRRIQNVSRELSSLRSNVIDLKSGARVRGRAATSSAKLATESRAPDQTEVLESESARTMRLVDEEVSPVNRLMTRLQGDPATENMAVVLFVVGLILSAAALAL